MPLDPVRVELACALRLGIPVIPVCVDGAAMPARRRLRLWSGEEAQLWDVATGRLEHRLQCPYPAFLLLPHGFTPDDHFLVGTTYSPWSFVVWEVATGAVAGSWEL